MSLVSIFEVLISMVPAIGITLIAVTVFILIFNALNVPKRLHIILWAVLIFRMLCPASIISGFSLHGLELFAVNQEKYESLGSNPRGDYEIALEGTSEFEAAAAAGIESDTMLFGGKDGSERKVVYYTRGENEEILPAMRNSTALFPTLSVIWLLGAMAMAMYGVASYISLKHKVREAVRCEGDAYETDMIKSPFVLGFLKPKIYLPLGLEGRDKDFVLAHERAHIKRFDYIVIWIFYLALCIHWYNPIVWAAFLLFVEDTESATDEEVIAMLGGAEKLQYSRTLLKFAGGWRILAASPISYSENTTKSRIKSVLRYKKPARFVSVLAVVLSLAVLVACGTDPLSKKKSSAYDPDDPILRYADYGISMDENRNIRDTYAYLISLTEENEPSGTYDPDAGGYSLNSWWYFSGNEVTEHFYPNPVSVQRGGEEFKVSVQRRDSSEMKELAVSWQSENREVIIMSFYDGELQYMSIRDSEKDISLQFGYKNRQCVYNDRAEPSFTNNRAVYSLPKEMYYPDMKIPEVSTSYTVEHYKDGTLEKERTDFSPEELGVLQMCMFTPLLSSQALQGTALSELSDYYCISVDYAKEYTTRFYIYLKDGNILLDSKNGIIGSDGSAGLCAPMGSEYYEKLVKLMK